MNENLNTPEIEDVEGHRVGVKVDGPDDVEGHRLNVPKISTDDDVEGHRLNVPKANADDADDVSGHVQPRRDLDIER